MFSQIKMRSVNQRKVEQDSAYLSPDYLIPCPFENTKSLPTFLGSRFEMLISKDYEDVFTFKFVNFIRDNAA